MKYVIGIGMKLMTCECQKIPYEVRTSYTVDMCESPDNCDMPECSCERLFTHQYVKKMYDDIHNKDSYVKWLEEFVVDNLNEGGLAKVNTDDIREEYMEHLRGWPKRKEEVNG